MHATDLPDPGAAAQPPVTDICKAVGLKDVKLRSSSAAVKVGGRTLAAHANVGPHHVANATSCPGPGSAPRARHMQVVGDEDSYAVSPRAPLLATDLQNNAHICGACLGATAAACDCCNRCTACWRGAGAGHACLRLAYS